MFFLHTCPPTPSSLSPHSQSLTCTLHWPPQEFQATLTHVDGQRLAQFSVEQREQAEALAARLRAADLKVGWGRGPTLAL